MSFKEKFDQYNWENIHSIISQQNKKHVIHALGKMGNYNLYDFMALISPAGRMFLDEMLELSQQVTRVNFGRRIRLYAPLYLSNFCHNGCTYCGFRIQNPMERKVLSEEEIVQEALVLKSHGYDHVLLVTGESVRHAGFEYLWKALKTLRPYFSNISIEVQPLKEEEYKKLYAEGLHAVYIYQETYRREHYRLYHPIGMKSHFYHRIETPDRLSKAGVKKIGLGILIGLEDWRTDSFFTALHFNYLKSLYPGIRCSISFPRLRPADGSIKPNVVMSDAELLQLICAYRICFEDIELALSTRESKDFRDLVVSYGITSMSAGSKTMPGGYATQEERLEQFQVCDSRTTQQVCCKLKSLGYEVIWNDNM